MHNSFRQVKDRSFEPLDAPVTYSYSINKLLSAPLLCAADMITPITIEQEAQLRKWLLSLGIAMPKPEDSIFDGVTPSLVHDPLRNGTLLCEIVAIIESNNGITGPRYKKVLNVNQARDNIELG